MQVVNPQVIHNKKVLLRYDIDVALRLPSSFDILRTNPERSRMGSVAQGHDLVVGEDYKLKAGLETLRLCLENASKVIIIGHLGRPQSVYTIGGKPFATAEDEKKGNPPQLSVKPIQEWLEQTLGQPVDFAESLEVVSSSDSKIVLLENIRFFHGEVPGAEYHATCISKTCDIDFAKKLASLGDFYVNEAFSSYNKAASTTMVPDLLPHAAGLRFVKEVETLLSVRNNPKKPFVAIMGGAKVKDKIPVINVLSQKADSILVGGKLAQEIGEQNLNLPKNVTVGKLSDDGLDISSDTTISWSGVISKAAQIIWNGPLGKSEDPKNNQTEKVVQLILNSKAEVVIGGGDSVAALSQYELLQKAQQKAFVSVGGGAMLKLLADGTLPTIEALV
ncbi:phosphoglycerate kinase [Candidatus Daviesbacteria bacterium]|nr:phosphoglycerate kinase [Candidatus Daviesbacteria bacterium]